MIRHTVIALALALATGCALHVELQNPRPNIDLDKTATALGFALTQDVPDTFVVPAQSGINPTNVAQWHETLRAGFTNGFGSAYQLADKGTASLTLELAQAELSFVPTAVSAAYGVAAAKAQLQFRARLLDPQGKAVCRSTGTAEAKNSITNAHEAGLSARSAVETMYEEIAKECFEHPAGAAHASR